MANYKTVVIYHSADFDGICCREIARKFLGEPFLIGWNYGDPVPEVSDDATLYMMDICIPELMGHPNLIWIDHHKTSIDRYDPETKRERIPGYRIDGVAACRLAWQWFTHNKHKGAEASLLPLKASYVDRRVKEPWAVRLMGEYDIWDRRDPSAELFQHGLRSTKVLDWDLLLKVVDPSSCQHNSVVPYIEDLLKTGKIIQSYKQDQDDQIISSRGFDLQFGGLNFLALNTARCNSLSFAAGIRPEHDGLFGYCFDGKQYRVSLYGVPHKPDIDLSAIAKNFGGGGHKQACGFTAYNLRFIRAIGALQVTGPLPEKKVFVQVET